MLESVCPVFPAMYEAMDEEFKSKKKFDIKYLKEKVFDLCYLCGMCPCETIPLSMLEAKTEYVDDHGQSRQSRFLANIESLGKRGCLAPSLTNSLLKKGSIRSLVERVSGIDRRIKIPDYPEVTFEKWMARHKKKPSVKTSKENGKVAYYAGCSTNYYYPKVGMAVVEVLERNNVEVIYPEQRCCGMPSLVEGERKLTLDFVNFNIKPLSKAVGEGYDIVVSCPTCTFLFKEVMEKKPYFDSLNQEKMDLIRGHTYDVGEYLEKLQKEGKLNTDFGPIPSKIAYFPPCHLKAQRIGLPFLRLMRLVPKLSINPVSGNYCCGIGGTFGFKHQFYGVATAIGNRVVGKINSMSPEAVTTDCNGCRIWLEQSTQFKVNHPAELLKEAYEGYSKSK